MRLRNEIPAVNEIPVEIPVQKTLDISDIKIYYILVCRSVWS